MRAVVSTIGSPAYGTSKYLVKIIQPTLNKNKQLPRLHTINMSLKENDMDDIYKKIEEHNPKKKRKILIIFDDMIADILSNKKCNPIVTELFIRRRKISISLAFNTKSNFAVPKNIQLKKKASTNCI